MPRYETAWRTFHIVGGQWGRQKADATEDNAPVHEDGDRDHGALVVTAEKWLSPGKKARALSVSSGMLRERRNGNGASALQDVHFPKSVS